jgi:hypothetical protein
VVITVGEWIVLKKYICFTNLKFKQQTKMYDDSLKVKDALQLYFSQYHFKDGGYNEKWFKIKLGRIFIPLPNIKARVDAVKLHDIHHLITEYNANYKGEAQIGGWEIASGCGRFWVAWILNMGSFVIGILFFQRSLLKAFLDGRLVKTNLYAKGIYNEILLNKTVGDLRKEVAVNSENKNSIADYFLFILWCLLSLCYHAILLLIAVLIIKILSDLL